jgi:hypothetical protein
MESMIAEAKRRDALKLSSNRWIYVAHVSDHKQWKGQKQNKKESK